MIILFMLVTTALAESQLPFPPVAVHRCPRNEQFVLKSSNCQVTCANRHVTSPDSECKPYTGCVCTKGHVRLLNDATGPCISPKFCPPELCAPTCAIPNPRNCPYIDYNICGKGRILSKFGGECINIEDCPDNLTCNGDPNAVIKACPLPCPSTCDAPNAVHCLRMCEPVGCECKPGYLLTKHNGRCILPEKCPGGYPCNANETFVPCKFDCISNNCPQNDDCYDDIVCDLPFDCLSGCVCKKKYKHKSDEDETCILARDCPPIDCNRPNEVWNSCPECDLNEYCEESPIISDCDPNYCEPRCICKKGFYRNNNSICVSPEECPPKRCVPTCAIPNPPDCSYIDYDICKPGYILNEIGGKCIKIKYCPDRGCNGDPHAVVKECPLPCPSTCDTPDAVNCLRLCDPVGCECAPGYIRSKYNGKCILPEKCPGGYPCQGNQTFVQCKIDCTSNYCAKDDSLDNVMCKYTYVCFSGCTCNYNYIYKSELDKTCILAEECPPVHCTRQNEVWNSCPDCDLYENCEDEDEDQTNCDTQLCIPRCICKENFYRNYTGICVPPYECPDYDFNW